MHNPWSGLGVEREENLLLMWRKLIMAKHQFAQETYLTYQWALRPDSATPFRSGLASASLQKF